MRTRGPLKKRYCTILCPLIATFCSRPDKISMPELPEVETVKRHLSPHLTRIKLVSADILLPRIFENREKLALPKGQRFTRLLRRGKYLVLEMERLALIFHLGMTGQLLIQDKLETSPHNRGVFYLSSGKVLIFRDIRTFGRMILTSRTAWQNHPRLKKLGFDPVLGPLPKVRDIPLRFRHSTRCVKNLLLEQGFIAGVGNIYADEILHASRIHPLRIAKRITGSEWHTVYKNLRRILVNAIKASGTTFSDYRRPDGGRGKYSQRLRVYGRGGEPCHTCGSVLNKIRVSGRGTSFCPICQPLIIKKAKSRPE